MPPAVLYRQLPGEGLDAFIAEFRKAAARDPFGTVFIVPITHLVREIVHRRGHDSLGVRPEGLSRLCDVGYADLRDRVPVHPRLPPPSAALGLFQPCCKRL